MQRLIPSLNVSLEREKKCRYFFLLFCVHMIYFVVWHCANFANQEMANPLSLRRFFLLLRFVYWIFSPFTRVICKSTIFSFGIGNGGTIFTLLFPFLLHRILLSLKLYIWRLFFVIVILFKLPGIYVCIKCEFFSFIELYFFVRRVFQVERKVIVIEISCFSLCLVISTNDVECIDGMGKAKAQLSD